MENYRLDFDGSKFKTSDGYAVLKYKCSGNGIDHPYNFSANNLLGNPNTKNGFTGSITQIVPEYYQDLIDLPNGTIIEFRSKDGVLTNSFEYKVDKWIEL